MSFWEVVVGLVFGIISSFIAWGILFHLLVPRLRFAPKISKVYLKKSEDDKSGFKYRFRLENAGRRGIVSRIVSRDVIDIELIARLSVKGIHKEHEQTWNTVNVPLMPDASLSYRIPILRPAVKERRGGRKTIRLYPNSKDILQGQSVLAESVPDCIRKKAKDKTLRLEDLLKLGREAKLEVHAFCYDDFSGTRKLITSKPYTDKDICDGGYAPASLDCDESISQAEEEDNEV